MGQVLHRSATTTAAIRRAIQHSQASLRTLLLVAIDRTTKFAFVELHARAARRVAGDFLRQLIEVVPYRMPPPTMTMRIGLVTSPPLAGRDTRLRHAVRDDTQIARE